MCVDTNAISNLKKKSLINCTGHPIMHNNTQQKLGVAFSYLERKKTDNVSVSLSHTYGTCHWFFDIKHTIFFVVGVPFRLETPGVKKRPCGVFEVTWNPPSIDSGGGPLTGYQVQLHTSGGGNGGLRNCTALFSNHSCLFTDLRSETEYQIRVRAFNKKGPGQWAHTSKKMDLIGKSFILTLVLHLHYI